MVRNLKQSVDLANKVSKGFLGMDLSEISAEGDLDTALLNMVEKLREITVQIRQASEYIASSSKQISSSAESVAQGRMNRHPLPKKLLHPLKRCQPVSVRIRQMPIKPMALHPF